MPKALMLVRHAESTNRDLRSQVWREVEHDYDRFRAEYKRRREHNPSLSERGRVQAKELAKRLVSDVYLHEDETLIVTSPMQRALETALPLIRCSELPRERVMCHPELFEVRSSFPYGERRISEIAATIEADFGLRCGELPDDDAYLEREEAEREDEAEARVVRTWAWLTSLLDDDRCSLVIVVAHGSLISRWLQQLFGPPKGRKVSFEHDHAGLTWVSWDKHEAVIEYVNNSDHVIKGLRPSRDDVYRMMLSVLADLDD